MTKVPAEEKALIRAMIERMRQAYAVEKKDLPSIFGVEAKSINNWVHYGRVPYDQMRQCHDATGKSMDWLMFGTLEQPCLSKEDNAAILTMMRAAIRGAVEYKTITFRYPDAEENIIEKFNNDLKKWFATKTTQSESDEGEQD